MLRSMQDLENYAIAATDGPIGHVKDFYFDDQAWVIRYLVVDTGPWLASRKVLISPISIHHPNWAYRSLPVSLSREQVRMSPEIDTERPVSRQHEIEYLAYYDYPYYWDGSGLWGAAGYPEMMMPGYAGFDAAPRGAQSTLMRMQSQRETDEARDDDPHLRSCQAVIGYHVDATDGRIGHVQGLLVDEQTWAIRYLVVDTSNWWIGHQVLVPPQWIADVRWADSSVAVHLTRAAVQSAPAYEPGAQLDRGQEIAIYKHYGRPVYWSDQGRRAVAA
jgi:hypothetical protein